jgi:glutamate decarboxylase
VFDLSERLRARGWLVPAYTFPAGLQDTAVMRIVVKNGFSQDMASSLLADLRTQVRMLEDHPRSPVPLADDNARQSFAH